MKTDNPSQTDIYSDLSLKAFTIIIEAFMQGCSGICMFAFVVGFLLMIKYDESKNVYTVVQWVTGQPSFRTVSSGADIRPQCTFI